AKIWGTIADICQAADDFGQWTKRNDDIISLIPAVGIGYNGGQILDRFLFGSDYYIANKEDLKDWGMRSSVSVLSTYNFYQGLLAIGVSGQDSMGDIGAKMKALGRASLPGGSKGTGKGADFYVTPKGDAISSNRNMFDDNLSNMVEKNGKFYGEASHGPIRVRVDDGHPRKPDFSGYINPDHEIPHVHVEYRKNGSTGPWGKGDSINKIIFPQHWLK
ncbi:MAG: hypothetical protein ACOCRL_00690, partial [Bacillota bacterium]